MGRAVRALVQPGAQAQWHPLCVTAAAPYRRRPGRYGGPSCPVYQGPGAPSGTLRTPHMDWSPMGPVTLNLEPDSVIAEHVKEKLIQPLAA